MLSSFLFSSYSMPAAIAVVKISVMSYSHLCYGLPLLHFPTTRIIFGSLFQSIVPLHVAKLSVFDACQHRTTIRIRLCGRYIHDYFISILISIYVATENTCSHRHKTRQMCMDTSTASCLSTTSATSAIYKQQKEECNMRS